MFHPGFLFGLIFDHEDGCDMFLRNGCLSPDYMAVFPKKTDLLVVTAV
jgi:hypothetical protein